MIIIILIVIVMIINIWPEDLHLQVVCVEDMVFDVVEWPLVEEENVWYGH